MSDTPDLDAILNENAMARAERRQQAEAEAAEAADVMDRLAHPGEDDETRAERRAQEAERQRLAALGVKFHD